MPVDLLNTHLAQVWKVLRNEAQEGIREKVSAWNSGNLTFQLKAGGYQPDFNAPPGLEVDSANPDKLTLAVPLGDRYWSLAFSGYLNGIIKATFAGQNFQLLTVTNKPLALSLSQFRLRLTATLDRTDVMRPLLTDLVPDLNLELKISDALDIQIGSGDWKQVTDGSEMLALRAKVEAFKLDSLIDQLQNVTFSGDLTLQILPVPDLQLTGKVNLAQFGSVGVDFHLPVPAALHDFFQSMRAGKVPVRWGEGHPETVDPPTMGQGQDLDAAAQTVEAAIIKHMPISSQGVRYPAVLDTHFDSDALTVPDYYDGASDVAIWTGHYIAAEAFRYAVEARRGNDVLRNEARERIQFLLDGITRLFEVPRLATKEAGDERVGLCCRAVFPAAFLDRLNKNEFDPAAKPNEYYKATLSTAPGGGNEVWFGKARDTDAPTRDSLTGLILGLALAHKLVSEPNIQATAAGLVTNLTAYLKVNAWNLPTPKGEVLLLDNAGKLRTRVLTSYFLEFNHLLALLCAAKSVNPAFTQDYEDAAAALAEWHWLPVWADTLDPISKYYKFNLHHGNLALLLFLDQTDSNRNHYAHSLNILATALGHHRNAYFNLVRILAEEPVNRPGFMQQNSVGAVRPSGVPLTLQEETVTLLHDWLDRAAAQRPGGGLPLERTVCDPLAPPNDCVPCGFFDDLINNNEIVQYQTPTGELTDWVATRPFKVMDRTGGGLDFLWQHAPFLTGIRAKGFDPGTDCISDIDLGDARMESPGVDYLLAYWMAAYVGVV